MRNGWTNALRFVGGIVALFGFGGLFVLPFGAVLAWTTLGCGVTLFCAAWLGEVRLRMRTIDGDKHTATPQRSLGAEQRELVAALVQRPGALRIEDGTRRIAGVGLALSAGALVGLFARAWVAPTSGALVVLALLLGGVLVVSASAWWRLRRAALAPGIYSDGVVLLHATLDELACYPLGEGLLAINTERDCAEPGVRAALHLLFRDGRVETLQFSGAADADAVLALLERDRDVAELEGPPPRHEVLVAAAYRDIDEPPDAREARLLDALARGARGTAAATTRAHRRRVALTLAVAIGAGVALTVLSALVEQGRFLARCVDGPAPRYRWDGRTADPPLCLTFSQRFRVRLLAGRARARMLALYRQRFTHARHSPQRLRKLMAVDTSALPGIDPAQARALTKLYRHGGRRRIGEIYRAAQTRVRSARCRGVPLAVAQALAARLDLASARGGGARVPVFVDADTDAATKQPLPPSLGGAGIKAARIVTPSKVFGSYANAERAKRLAKVVGVALGRLVGAGTLEPRAQWDERGKKAPLWVSIRYRVEPVPGIRLRSKRGGLAAFGYGPTYYVGLAFEVTFDLHAQGQRVFRLRRRVPPPKRLGVSSRGRLSLVFGPRSRDVYERMLELMTARFAEALMAALGSC